MERRTLAGCYSEQWLPTSFFFQRQRQWKAIKSAGISEKEPPIDAIGLSLLADQLLKMAKRCNKTSLVGLSLSTLDDLLALTLACRYKNRKSIKRPPSCAPLCEKNNNLGDSAGLEHRKAWHYCCSPCRPLLIYWVNNKKRGEGETSDTKWPNAFSFLFFLEIKKRK